MNRFQTYLVGLLVLVLSLSVCVGVAAEDLTKVHYYPAWINHWENGGFLVAAEQGFYQEQGLKVEIFPGGPGLNPLNRMMSDKTISFATYYNWFALKIRMERNIDLKVIATDFQAPALHLVSWVPIEKPEDLFGKKVEVWPGYGYPLKTFLGQNRDKVTIQNQGGNMKRFFAKRVTASHAMVYNELILVKRHFGLEEITPDRNKYKTEDGDFIYVYRFGQLNPKLTWDENSLITRKRTLEKHPEVVKKFVHATYQGWKWAMTHDPDKVMDILLKYNDALKPKKEKQGGAAIHELMIDQNTCEYGLGYVNPEPWKGMANTLFRAGLLKNKPTEQQIKDAYHYIPSEVYPPQDRCK